LPPGALARLGTIRFRGGQYIGHIASSPDSKLFASVAFAIDSPTGGYVTLWDATTGKEVRRLDGLAWGHSVAFSSDGNTLASASLDGRDHFSGLWDVATGRLLRRLQTPARLALAFSPDGRAVAGARADDLDEDRDQDPTAVCLWDVKDGLLLRKLYAPGLVKGRPRINTAVFSPDGKMLAGGADDGSVYLWNPATGIWSSRLAGHQAGVEAIQFLAGGKILASAGNDGTVRLWDLATGKELRQLEVAGAGELAVPLAGSPDGRYLAYSGRSGQPITLWDVAAGRVLRQFPLQCCHAAQALAFTADGKTLAVARAAVIELWDVATGKEIRPADGHIGAISAVAFADGGSIVATAGADATIRLWDPATGRELRRLEGHRAGLTALAVSPDGQSLAAGGWGHDLRVWDVRTGRQRHQLERRRGAITGLAFSSSGKALTWVSTDEAKGRAGCAILGAAKRNLASFGEGQFYAWPLMLSPDGRRAVVFQGYWGDGCPGSLVLRELVRGAELVRLERTEDNPALSRTVSAVGFSGDGKTLAMSRRGGVILWEIATGQVRGRLDVRPPDALVTRRDAGTLMPESFAFYGDGRPSYPAALAISPGGRLLAVAGKDHTVHIWDLASGAEVRKLRGHRAEVRALAFAPAGRMLVTADADGIALVWDTTDQAGARLPVSPIRDEAALEQLWTDLAADDAKKADQAMWTLASVPDRALPLLREHLRPVPQQVTPGELAQLISELDSERFAVRQRADAKLRSLEEQAEPALRQALAGRIALEAQRRMERLLQRIEPRHGPILNGDWLRTWRALEAVERMGTPEARALLQRLGGGAPGARLTQEAAAALQRIGPCPAHGP
jgi:WD40 repeat protein